MLDGLQQDMQSTNFDGTNSDLYVSYYQLNQVNGSGLQFPLSPLSTMNFSMDTNLNYVAMMWFKPTGYNWNKMLQYAFQISGSFQCYFTQSSTMVCESTKSSQKLVVSTANVYLNSWSHLTVSGQASSSSYAMLESRTDVLSQVTTSYAAMQWSTKDWSGCIGSCNNQPGFEGGVRDFVFALSYVSPATARKIKNHYLTWDFTIMAYFRFGEKLGLKDEFRLTTASAIGRGKSTLQKDYISNDICYPFPYYEQLMKFSGDNTLQTMTIGGRWNPQYTNYFYTMSVMLSADRDHCSATNPADAINTCSIIHVRDVFLMYFDSANSVRFQFFALEDYYQTTSPSVFVPSGQFINIQLAISQFGGYQIQTYDVQGRLMANLKKVYNLQQQRPQTKVVELFNNFRGYVKYFVLQSKAVPLPFYPPNGNIKDPSFMFYLKFGPNYYVSGSVQNLGDNGDGVQENVPASSPKFDYVNTYDSLVSGQTTAGLLTASKQLFDGIACDDGQLNLQIGSSTSYVQAKTLNMTNPITNATVELWIKPTKVANLQGIFQLYSAKAKHQYMDIYLTPSKQLICAPFGMDTVNSPQITYSDLTDLSIVQYNWFHISCSYTQSVAVNGYLYGSNDYNFQYTAPLDQSTDVFPPDIYTMYIGNRQSLKEGSSLLLIRDVKLWQVERTLPQIKRWRNRQVNPMRYQQQNQLLAYFRMAEASYSEFNYNVIAQKNLTSAAVINGINYVKDTQLVICPQQSYLYNGTCYNQPFQLFLITAFPTVDAQSQQFWNFTIRQSAILRPEIFDEVTTYWSSSNSVVQSLIGSQQGALDLLIPVAAFANQQPYDISVNVSNQYATFVVPNTLSFLPVSCQYVVLDSTSDAYSAYNLFNAPASTSDITFSLSIKSAAGGCTTYYNQFIPKITYILSPQPDIMPTLNVVQLSSTSLQVTIPRDQQNYFPKQQDVKIIMQMYWTNTDYSALINPQQSTFQHAVYTINFAYQSFTVEPILTSSSNLALINTPITLDASKSYITGQTGANKYQNLTFSWQCPADITALCSGQTGNQFVIPYDAFVGAGGQFNTTYTFNAVINWHTPSDTDLQYFVSQQVIWQQVKDPNFTIVCNNPNILVTQDNLFSLTFDNYQLSEVADNLKVTWSVTPAVTKATLFKVSNDSLSAVVNATGFKNITQYIVQVNVTDKVNPIAFRTHSFVQTTLTAPYGGNASISPNAGFTGDTQFSVQIRGWKSIAPPVVYQVWQAGSSTGKVPITQLTTDWVTNDQNFTFVATQTYPIIIIVSDGSKEITQYGPLFPKITSVAVQSLIAQNTALQSNIKVLSTSSNSISDKYELLLQLANDVLTSITDQSQKQSTIQFILDSIQTDTNKINTSDYINKGYSQIVLEQATQVLSTPTFASGLSDQAQAQQLLTISKQLSSSTIFNKQVQSSSTFVQSYANQLSSLVNSRWKSRRRMLATTDTTNTDVNYQASLQIKTLANSACANLNFGNTQQVIQTETYQVYLQWVNSQITSEYFTQSLTTDPLTNTKLHLQDLQDDLKYINNVDSSSLCLQTIFYTQNPLSQNLDAQTQTQYLDTTTIFDIIDADQVSLYKAVDMKQYVTTNFAIKQEEDLNNQTVCMQYDSTAQNWKSQLCLTQIDSVAEQIICHCSIIANSLVTVITDTQRDSGNTLFYKQDPNAYIVVVNGTSNVSSSSQTGSSSQRTSLEFDQNYTILSMILVLICLGTFVPIIGYLLDKKDFHYAIQKLDASTIKTQLLLKVVEISQEPLSYWKYKKDLVLSYNIESSSFFTHLVQQIHPLFSLFTKFNVFESRNTRFFAYFLQISLYSLICVLTFGPYYRSDRNQLFLENTDVGYILSICLIGQVLLLPTPFSLNQISQKLYKQRQLKKAEVESQQAIMKQEQLNSQTLKHNSSSRSNAYLPQITQEQNILNQSSPNIQNNRSAGKRDFVRKQLQEQQEQDIVFQPQCNLLKVLLIVTTYLVALISIVLASVYSKQNKKNTSFNQQCIVLTFFLGLFVSIFITNMLRVALNAVFVSKKNKNQVINKLLLSEQAHRIYKEIEFVKLADKELFQQYDTMGYNRDDRDQLLDNSPNHNKNEQVNQIKQNMEIRGAKFNEDDLKDIILFEEEENDYDQNNQNNKLRIQTSRNTQVQDKIKEKNDQSDIMEEQISYKTKDHIMSENNIVQMDDQFISNPAAFKQNKDQSPSGRIYANTMSASNNKKMRKSQERVIEERSGMKSQQLRYQCVTEKNEEQF